MNLDIRLPIGAMFSLIGAILAISGFLTNSNTEMYPVSYTHLTLPTNREV